MKSAAEFLAHGLCVRCGGHRANPRFDCCADCSAELAKMHAKMELLLWEEYLRETPDLLDYINEFNSRRIRNGREPIPDHLRHSDYQLKLLYEEREQRRAKRMARQFKKY